MNVKHKEQGLVEVQEEVDVDTFKALTVFNDNFNTFEHVISTLVKVCKHSAEQAEQCTWIIHHRGKCSVKVGSFDHLRPMREAICEAGIDAKII